MWPSINLGKTTGEKPSQVGMGCAGFFFVVADLHCCHLWAQTLSDSFKSPLPLIFQESASGLIQTMWPSLASTASSHAATSQIQRCPQQLPIHHLVHLSYSLTSCTSPALWPFLLLHHYHTNRLSMHTFDTPLSTWPRCPTHTSKMTLIVKVKLDEAFIDFWADSLLDTKHWLHFILCQLRPFPPACPHPCHLTQVQ